jgi:hypothetical protein
VANKQEPPYSASDGVENHGKNRVPTPGRYSRRRRVPLKAAVGTRQLLNKLAGKALDDLTCGTV